MKAKISTKMGYVRTDGWREYSQPIYAVAGANDTGTWSDSPCNSVVRKREITGFTKMLREAKIPYVLKWANSSNVFCMKQFVIVAESDHEKAYDMAEAYVKDTDLFYSCTIIKAEAVK